MSAHAAPAPAPDSDPAHTAAPPAPDAGSVEVRTLTEADYPGWARANNTGFLLTAQYSEEDLALRLSRTVLERARGAFDAGRCVATYRSFPQQLTVPGGRIVQASAVSSVTVTPTHRRRGLLSRMIRADLAESRERGEVVSTLIAAEYPIYGRYGFGHATSLASWEIDTHRTGLDRRWAAPECGGRIDLVDAADVRKTGPELHERFRAGQHGAIDRSAAWWENRTGLTSYSFEPYKPAFHAVYRAPESAGGEVEGLVVYRADDNWGDAKQPLNTVSVSDLIATTPAAERALWRFLCSIDWVAKVRTGYRAPDDLLPDLLPDPRAARVVSSADWLWVRVLDVVRALEARTYAEADGFAGAGGAAGERTVVLEVADRLRLAGGRFRLSVSPDGEARCVPTEEEPELKLDVRELGALYLGGRSAARMVALGLVEEVRPGTAVRVDALFRTAREPWCPDIF
ncbi:GNAT family N-acetyltransferase [Streptomyces sp. NPDC004111]|uniref:GNAT family N-acetyltransferase n=1 Tax=Streptomyces sp. NPDC004111 TaxID=3364690 RepID=UPI00369431EF